MRLRKNTEKHAISAYVFEDGRKNTQTHAKTCNITAFAQTCRQKHTILAHGAHTSMQKHIIFADWVDICSPKHKTINTKTNKINRFARKQAHQHTKTHNISTQG